MIDGAEEYRAEPGSVRNAGVDCSIRVLPWENVINFHGLKNGGHVEVGLLLGGEIRHITATQAEVKEVPDCVRKYCFNASIFGNISSACVKEYIIAALMLS